MEKSAVHFVLFLSGVVMIGSHSVFALRTVLYGTAALLIFLIACKVFFLYRAEMAKARAVAKALSNQRQTFVKPMQNQAIQMYKMPENQGFAPLTESVREPVIPCITDALFLAIIGPQGTGKSTLLKHLIHSRGRADQIIIDPHGAAEDYNGISPVGMGRDYQQINNTLEKLVDELNARYKSGHFRHQMLYVYIDETTLLNKNCPSFGKFMEVMLTESRKVSIRITVCLHSRRAKFFGLEGAYDLVEGVQILTLKREGDRRWGELETDEGKKILSLPGPFMGKVTGCADRCVKGSVKHATHPFTHENPVKSACVNVYTPENTSGYTGSYTSENTSPRIPFNAGYSEILERFNRKESVSRIGEKVFGTRSGPNNERVRKVLREYGMME